MAEGRRLALYQSAWCANARDWDPSHWIATGRVKRPRDRRAALQADPAVRIAQAQIAKDGGILVVENVMKAVEQWRAAGTSKPEKPT